jgi:hypothetical protein
MVAIEAAMLSRESIAEDACGQGLSRMIGETRHASRGKRTTMSGRSGT